MDRERYLLAVTTFWLPLCLLETDRWRRQARGWRRVACVTLMATNLPLFVARGLSAGMTIQQRVRPGERFYAPENPAWSNPDLEQLAAWIHSNVRHDEVVCAENPFLINFFTESLALVQPEQIPASDFPGFLQNCNVRYWICNRVHTKWPQARLDALRAAARRAGWQQAARCGTYEIWKLPG
jgi:hypothetical protein